MSSQVVPGQQQRWRSARGVREGGSCQALEDACKALLQCPAEGEWQPALLSQADQYKKFPGPMHRLPCVPQGKVLLHMPFRPIVWWLKLHLFLQDEPRDDDPLIRSVLPVQHQSSVNKEGACGDIQKAAAHALARHQGAVAAGLAAISKERSRGACL